MSEFMQEIYIKLKTIMETKKEINEKEQNFNVLSIERRKLRDDNKIVEANELHQEQIIPIHDEIESLKSIEQQQIEEFNETVKTQETVLNEKENEFNRLSMERRMLRNEDNIVEANKLHQEQIIPLYEEIENIRNELSEAKQLLEDDKNLEEFLEEHKEEFENSNKEAEDIEQEITEDGSEQYDILEKNEDIDFKEILKGKENNENQQATIHKPKVDSYQIMRNLDIQRAKEQINNITDFEKIFVSIDGNNLVYSYEDDAETKQEFSIFDLKNKLKNAKFEHDPFLAKFLKTPRGNNLLKELEERQKAQEDLEDLKSLISYDMYGSENLSWRERSGLRKLAKILKKQDFEVKNYESIKFSFKNDVLKGIGNLFRGAMKGITGGSHTQVLLEESKEKQVTDEEMKKMIEKEEVQNSNIDRLGHNVVKGEEDIKREQVEEKLKNSNSQEITQEEHEIQQ